MPTCIEQRGCYSWRVTISAGYKDGKQQRIRRSYRFPEEWSKEKQRKEVEKKAALLYAEYCNDRLSPGRDMLFSEFADLWMDQYAKVNLEAKVCYGAKTRLNRFILPYFGRMRLSQIRTLTITQFINDLIVRKTSKSGKPLTARTAINYLGQLSSMFSTAMRWELLTNNPCHNVIKPKLDEPDITILNERQSAFMLEKLVYEPIMYQCIIYMAIMTGFRLGEIEALKWSDVNFESRQVSVVRARTYVPSIGSFDKTPKTKTSKRTVTIPFIVISKLEQLHVEYDARKAKLGSKWKDNGYLFSGFDGSPLGHNSPSRWFHEYLLKLRNIQKNQCEQESGSTSQLSLIPIIRFHDLRHTHASLLLAEGVDLETVSKRLGHAKTSTTANIYCHPMKEKDSLAATLIERLLVKSDQQGGLSGVQQAPPEN